MDYPGIGCGSRVRTLLSGFRVRHPHQEDQPAMVVKVAGDLGFEPSSPGSKPSILTKKTNPQDWRFARESNPIFSLMRAESTPVSKPKFSACKEIRTPTGRRLRPLPLPIGLHRLVQLPVEYLYTWRNRTSFSRVVGGRATNTLKQAI